jgi:glyoxylase-like metal-dependent hydrolase (beta-lactamase superfamily II)
VLRWRRTAPRHPWPRTVPVVTAHPAMAVAGLRVTMIGHATVLIQLGGLNLLTDPVWADRASPVRFAGPRRVTAPGVALADLPPIHAVLLSHNHYDHLDVATLKALHRAHAPLILTRSATIASCAATWPMRASSRSIGTRPTRSIRPARRRPIACPPCTGPRARRAIVAWRCGVGS